jgi:hypothetical protein
MIARRPAISLPSGGGARGGVVAVSVLTIDTNLAPDVKG